MFILDEIVTGFRFNFGSYSSVYHLDPDMITLGKIVGGGLPIGVLCGKKEIMKVANPVENMNKEQTMLYWRWDLFFESTDNDCRLRNFRLSQSKS